MLCHAIDTNIYPIPQEYVCVDVETTGLYQQYDCIIDVAAVLMSRGEIKSTFSSIVAQNRPIPKKIQRLTGITEEMVRTGMNEGEAMGRFCDFIQDHTIVGHNVRFDLQFLWNACVRAGRSFDNLYIDTLTLAKNRLPDLEHYRLEDVAARLHVEQTTAHRAEADAIVAGLCLEKLREIHPEIKNPDELWRQQSWAYGKAARMAGKPVWKLTTDDKLMAAKAAYNQNEEDQDE